MLANALICDPIDRLSQLIDIVGCLIELSNNQLICVEAESARNATVICTSVKRRNP